MLLIQSVHPEHAKRHVSQRICNEGYKIIESGFFKTYHEMRKTCVRRSSLCLYLMLHSSFWSVLQIVFLRMSRSFACLFFSILDEGLESWCDVSRGIGRCGAVFFHYATGVDLEFTLRSADVVEKQDGPTAWIKSVRWIRGYIIQSKGWARTNGLYTSFFCHP